MRDLVDTFLADLRLRYAECSNIDLALTAKDDIHELVGAFQARRDDVVRRHVYRIAKSTAGDDVAVRAELAHALERFRREMDLITRLPKKPR